MGKRQYRLFESEQIDENGEVISIHKDASYILDNGPNYIMLYLDEVLNTLYDLPLSCSTVLFGLLRKVNYANSDDSMVVYVNSSLKQDLVNNSSLTSINTVNNALGLLVQKGILHHISRGKYQLNPFLFGKGKWTDIYELRMTHIWNNFGHTVKLKVKRQKRLPITLSNKDKKLYEKIISLQTVSEMTQISFDELVQQSHLILPKWWKLLG